jgi:hypothetical protein
MLSKQIYQELLRFLKAFQIVYDKELKNQNSVTKETVLKDLDEVLGERALNLNDFWSILVHHDFVDAEKAEKNKVEIKRGPLKAWLDYLLQEVEGDRYTLLSHSSLALLRRVVCVMKLDQTKIADISPEVQVFKKDLVGGAQEVVVVNEKQEDLPTATVLLKDLEIENMPFKEDALSELSGLKIIEKLEDQIKIKPDEIIRLYLFQSILKTFDHSISAV